jgi:hypothetical protein
MTDHDKTITMSQRDFQAMQDHINQLQKRGTLMKNLAIAATLVATLIAYHDVRADNYQITESEIQQLRQTEALQNIQNTLQQQQMQDFAEQSQRDWEANQPAARGARTRARYRDLENFYGEDDQ